MKVRGVAYIVLIFLFGCKIQSNQVESVKTSDTLLAEPVKEGVCNVSKFMTFDRNSTFSSVISYLDENNIQYTLENKGEIIADKYFKNGDWSLGSYSMMPQGIYCTCAKFIVIHTLSLDELYFNNAILTFYNDRIAEISLYEPYSDNHGQVSLLKELYERKYGNSEYKNNKPISELWIYTNEVENVRVLFSRDERNDEDGFATQDGMIMQFPTHKSLFECCEGYRNSEEQKSKEREKEVLKQI